nr:MAG: rhomboid family intramembrane serine protease [Hyphomicrobiales bacterium]
MIPISDDNPVRHTPVLNYAFVACCIAIFVWQVSLTDEQHGRLLQAFAFIPAHFFQSAGLFQNVGVPSPDSSGFAWMTLATSMFLHGGWMHLGGNMLYLWIFGNNVEDALGHTRYLIFYFVCGLVAALTQGMLNPGSYIPVVGASGAISGVLAAYLLIFPRARVTVIVPLGILLYPLKISALYVIGFWFLIQLLQGLFADSNDLEIAWWAHIGGFISGLIMAPMLSRFPLFGRRRAGPWG